MIALGIASGFYVGNQDASAVVMRDGELIAAVYEMLQLLSEEGIRTHLLRDAAV